MSELLFHGAAGEVTGSMHMIEVDGAWVALDCGLFQGRRAVSEEKNRAWPVPPAQIEAVVLSHAHTDHSGRLPRLVRDGFDGPIFCTSATRDLCALMLPDSAHIQMEDIVYINKKRKRKGLPPVEPLYDYSHALGAVKRIHSIPYNDWFQPVPGLLARFQEAGHMLGSAGVHLALGKRNGSAPTLYFSGDVGRPHTPILRDPAPFPSADVLICESTYGARVNDEPAVAEAQFVEVARRTHERGGKLIIPAFSVGRTQTIVYFLHRQMAAGKLPRLPVFVDSPLSVNATDVFRLHPECFDREASAFQAQTGDLLGAGCCTFIRDVEESKQLHERRDPCTIISASGMCEAGRIQHHIKNNVQNPRNTLLFPGFQAEGTLGRKLVDGAKEFNLFHETWPVRAEVVQLSGFSGHADQRDLLAMFDAGRQRSSRVYLVHGEPDQSAELARLLRERAFPHVEAPQRGQRAALN